MRVWRDRNKFFFSGVCLAIIIFVVCLPAGAATSGRSIAVTTNPLGRTAIPTTAAALMTCTVPCECLSISAAQAKWGAGGYTQCSNTPCYQYSSELGSIRYYCFQKKAVTTAVIGNIPPVTTTLVPAISKVPVVTTTTIKQISIPAAATTDSDRDGDADALDNCPQAYNPAQTDSDADGRGNACDTCWQTPDADQTDQDGDCAAHRNSAQFWYIDKAVDSSYWINDPKCGDACDTCSDPDYLNQPDTDNDGIGDGCSPASGGKAAANSSPNLQPLKVNVERVEFRTGFDTWLDMLKNIIRGFPV